ncbi:hypothetical protein [Streptomyces sp. S.PB5]|uniref:hypothetical protein n=1 Tax=Streptomyces sp. S.PB5 TaxID=3020844 RepID=UPI0025B1C2C1|nr:hypothetical protein [Streptomyces sp. S.PB5]MDN3023464.1 hypothetical protein [Streptomyces sp. S.PB5]
MTTSRSIPNVTDERLCWLIVRDELRRRTGRLRFFGWATVLFSGRPGNAAFGGDLRREHASDKMTDYAVAVDAAAQALSATERTHLRATAELPDWFLPDVERRYRQLRKRR